MSQYVNGEEYISEDEVEFGEEQVVENSNKKNNKRKREDDETSNKGDTKTKQVVVDLSDEDDEEEKVESFEERHAKRVKHLKEYKEASDARMKAFRFGKMMTSITNPKVMDSLMDYLKTLDDDGKPVTKQQEQPKWYEEWFEDEIEDAEDIEKAKQECYDNRFVHVETLKSIIEESNDEDITPYQQSYLIANLDLFYKPY